MAEKTAIIISALNFVLLILNVWEKLEIRKAKSPNAIQNNRLTALEQAQEDIGRKLDNDNRRIKRIEEGNRVTQQSLLALLSHGIDGNSVDAMKEAKSSLETFLIYK